MNLGKAMLKPRRASMRSGKGDVWFYVSPSGIELEISDEKGGVSAHSVVIGVHQLRHALKIIEEQP